MDYKVIKTEPEYYAALHEAENLISQDSELNTEKAEKLELLTLLIEDYERRQFHFATPDPIEAIEFRMNEQGLKQKDLVPLIGSRSRVSEILSRKRPLTVPMIRALSKGLGIPLEALVAEQRSEQHEAYDFDSIDWSKFPIKEMEKRGWFDALQNKAARLEDAVIEFLRQVSMEPNAALFRRNFKGEEFDQKTYFSTLAWTARVQIRAKEKLPVAKYTPTNITPEYLRDLARLSWFSEGPKMAMEMLEKIGVIVVIEPKLPNTLIDGAAMFTDQGVPVIGLTLRYDRIDYFWFTLLHELAHIWQHLNLKEDAFVDRIENMSSTTPVEKEANRIARDAFIPRSVWRRSPAFLSPSKENIVKLADELHIHPAIVAGRLQYETGRYESFREFLGQGLVSKCFPEINWN